MKKLEELHQELEKYDITPARLAVALIGPNEMVLGEDVNAGEAGHQHVTGNFVAIRNPRRLTRHTMRSQAGEILYAIQLTDFDLVDSGIIEVKPIGFFYLKWLGVDSQIRYCEDYVRYCESRVVAKAKEAGIEVAGSGVIRDLRGR